MLVQRLLAALTGLLACGATAEWILASYLPYQNGTIGTIRARNAALYGWGYDPGERIILQDPDSGRVLVSVANASGWRDRDRSIEGEPGAYRILVLGDSHTFGPVVPAEAIYTRVLEDRLRAASYRTEVISMAYGGFGTDQELEALRREGLAYRPDLVIFQFCVNDLADNDYFGQPDYAWTPKPFYYRIGAGGRLDRLVNPHFESGTSSWKDRLWSRAVSRSEVAKRANVLLSRDPRAQRWAREQPQRTYRATPATLEQLRLVLGLDAQSDFLADLARFDGEAFDEVDANSLVSRHRLGEQRAAILRIIEDRWFDRFWSAEAYHVARQDPGTYRWQLYFLLMEEAQRLVEESGARLAILSDNERGSYDWMREWQLVSDTPEAMDAFFEPTRIVRAFARERGIGFVEPLTPHQRARNDPHPNREGNRAMASNLLAYLLEHHAAELSQHRLPGPIDDPSSRRASTP
jgi:lysophospholipase L1-like esterase